MIKCSRCREEKENKEFYVNRTRLNGFQSECKKCLKSRYRYKGNEDKYKEWTRMGNERLDNLVNGLKNNPCTDCGKKYPHYVMEFDHIKDEKFMGICQMKNRRMSIEKIKEEISKCELVCANCHRERTNKRNPSRFSRDNKKIYE